MSNKKTHWSIKRLTRFLVVVMPLYSSLSYAQTTDAESDFAQHKGRYLAIASDCVACHTASGGKPFSGGLAMPLPMGNIYSTNITPDKTYGIGEYTLEDFKKVLREGIRRDGSNLYPAMPFPSYTKLTDEDIANLYAYFMHGVEPVNQPNKKPDFSWPLTLRWPLMAWNTLFLEKGAYQYKSDRSPEWNRGAYLVQGAAHCGSCHTPRGLGMQEKAYDESQKGFLAGAKIGGWEAFNITSDKASGIGSWTQQEIVQYLKTGNVPFKAQAAGSMAEAITHSFSKTNDADLNAIAGYLKDIQAVGDEQTRPRSSQVQPRPNDEMPGANIYLNNCASCHGGEGAGTTDGYYPSMLGNSVIGANDANNLIQVILHGANVNNGKDHYFMPAFSDQLSNQQIAQLAEYLVESFGGHALNVTPDQVEKLRGSSNEDVVQ
ncbi:cytochrome c [Serratia liquefaciens]|uniref:cytochrome c n=1 Tax=Serratia liquefaciens TaxID=614 RepID=UPI0019814F16|nr:cytochrome c [Serratia liquefaciens]